MYLEGSNKYLQDRYLGKYLTPWWWWKVESECLVGGRAVYLISNKDSRREGGGGGVRGGQTGERCRGARLGAGKGSGRGR